MKKAVKQQQKKGAGFFDVFNIWINDKNKSQNEDDKEAFNHDPNSVEVVSAMVNSEIRKLHETISQLKFENETYLEKMNKTLEESENKKLEFKNKIKTYTDKIKCLEDEIKMLKEEKEELQNRIKLTSSISS